MPMNSGQAFTRAIIWPWDAQWTNRSIFRILQVNISNLTLEPKVKLSHCFPSHNPKGESLTLQFLCRMEARALYLLILNFDTRPNVIFFFSFCRFKTNIPPLLFLLLHSSSPRHQPSSVRPLSHLTHPEQTIRHPPGSLHSLRRSQLHRQLSDLWTPDAHLQLLSVPYVRQRWTPQSDLSVSSKVLSTICKPGPHNKNSLHLIIDVLKWVGSTSLRIMTVFIQTQHHLSASSIKAQMYQVSLNLKKSLYFWI